MRSCTASTEAMGGLSPRHASGRSVRSALHFAFGVPDHDNPRGPRVGKDALELQALKEQLLIRRGPFLHDAGNPGKIISEEAEGLSPDGQAAGSHRERVRAVEGDDQRAPRFPRLELFQEGEENGLHALVLVEAPVARVSVLLLVADPERDGADERRKGR
jgi:hypothetical protein